MAMQSLESSLNLSSDHGHLYASWEDWDIGAGGDEEPDGHYGDQDEDERDDDLDGFKEDRSELFEEWDDEAEDEDEDEDDDEDDDEGW